MLIANNVVNLLSASYTTVFFTKLFNSNAVGIATGVITVLVIIFGEVIPKSYANANADNLIKAVAKPLADFICCSVSGNKNFGNNQKAYKKADRR